MEINDTQESELMYKAKDIVTDYNSMLEERDREIKSLNKEYQDKINKLRDKAVIMCDGLLTMYMDVNKRMIIDCRDELTKGITYITKGQWHIKNKV